jgi:hypothetical protein
VWQHDDLSPSAAFVLPDVQEVRSKKRRIHEWFDTQKSKDCLDIRVFVVEWCPRRQDASLCGKVVGCAERDCLLVFDIMAFVKHHPAPTFSKQGGIGTPRCH